MKKIGFKNFRRFDEFPTIDFAPITFLVGENNAGKSTVVKGILAISDFISGKLSLDLLLKDQSEYDKELLLRNIRFSFNTNYLAHIGTFKRALYNKAENNEIEFHLGFTGGVDIIFKIVGDRNNEEIVSGLVSKIEIIHCFNEFKASFDLQNNEANVVFSKELKDNDCANCEDETSDTNNLEPIKLKYKITENFQSRALLNCKNLIEQLISTIRVKVDRICDEEIDKKQEKERKKLKNLPITIGTVAAAVAVTMNPIAAVTAAATAAATAASIKKFSFNNDTLNRSILDIIKENPWRYFNDIKYIYAHSVSQSVIYSAKDSNDYMSRTIHEFATLSDEKNDIRRKFIQYWMNEFKIGEDYNIIFVGGEACVVKIKNDNEWVNLSDKGMGSIKLMVLLFRFAITLQEGKKSNKLPIFIIEEPEQNLHPMLQTKLADLFYELFKKYNYRFIVETHSEYIIRKTQVIVAENYSEDLDFEKNNPFKVYYFPSSGIPYDMKYTRSGMFEKKFGPGFMDEAGRLHMTVLKNSKK
jgi:predicted ATP-dependent endonuclease of OLD family